MEDNVNLNVLGSTFSSKRFSCTTKLPPHATYYFMDFMTMFLDNAANRGGSMYLRAESVVTINGSIFLSKSASTVCKSSSPFDLSRLLISTPLCRQSCTTVWRRSTCTHEQFTRYKQVHLLKYAFLKNSVPNCRRILTVYLSILYFVDNSAEQGGGGIDAYERNSLIVSQSTFSSKFVLERLHISISSSCVGHLFT